jgi:N-acetylmuramoyl-L-alanine amidase
MARSPILFLRAGHHDRDPGAVANGVQEAALTIALRDRIARHLRANGVLVELDNDTHNLAQDIARLHTQVRPQDLVLDIHFNAATPAASGTECFVSATPSQRAINIGEQLAIITAAELAIPNRHRFNAGRVKRESQTQHGRLGIMRLPCDVVLWEVCFITNPNDLASYNRNQGSLVCAVGDYLVSLTQV